MDYNKVVMLIVYLIRQDIDPLLKCRLKNLGQNQNDFSK